MLNVAGPRASKEPGVGEFVVRTLEVAVWPDRLEASRMLREISFSSSVLECRGWGTGVMEHSKCWKTGLKENSIPRR